MSAAKADLRLTLCRVFAVSCIVFAGVGYGYWRGWEACQAATPEVEAVEGLRTVEMISAEVDKIVLELWDKTPEERRRAIERIESRQAMRESGL